MLQRISQSWIRLVLGLLIFSVSPSPYAFAAPTQDLPSVKKDLGECYLSPIPQKKLEACTSLLNSGRLSGPGLSATHFLRALAYARLKRDSEANEDLAESARIDPDGIYGLLSRGTLSCDKKESAAALLAFSEVIRRQPNWSMGYLLRGSCYLLLRQNKEGVQDFTRAIDSVSNAPVPVRAQLYLARGKALAAAGNADEALKDLGQAVQMDSRLAGEVYNARGVIHAERREWLQAASEWARSAALNPNVASGYKRQGDALDNAGQSREAVAAYTKAIGLETNPKFLAQDHLDRAGALSNLEEWPKATEDYNEAIRIEPNAKALQRRGATLVLIGRLTEGLADLRQANELDPKDAYAVLWLAIAEAKLGHFDVEELKERAKALAPEWPREIVFLLYNEPAVDEPQRDETLSELHTQGRKCEMDFYIGAVRLAQGDRDEGVRRLKAAVESGAKEYIEYLAANTELKRLGIAVPAVPN